MFHPVVEIQNLLATHGFSWRVSLGMQVILGEDLGAVLERNAIQQGLKNCPKLSRKECIQLIVFFRSFSKHNPETTIYWELWISMVPKVEILQDIKRKHL